MDILHDFFLVPIMRNGWFNPVNSIAYGMVLIIGILAVFRLLKRLKIGIDTKLLISLIPFIAFAGVTRTLRDLVYQTAYGDAAFLESFTMHMHIMQEKAYDHIFSLTGNNAMALVDSYVVAWFPTPGSYLITFLLAIASLLAAVLVQRYSGVAYWKTMSCLGLLLFIINLAMLPIHSLTPLLYIGAVSAAWTALFFGLNYLLGYGHKKKWNCPLRNVICRTISGLSGRFSNKNRKTLSETLRSLFSRINCMVLSAHLFDATATFFAIAVFSTLAGQSYTEQHFTSRWIMPFLGPQVMFLLKLAVVLPVLYLIDKYVQEKEFSSFLKIVIFVLGLAPATRNITRLIVGV